MSQHVMYGFDITKRISKHRLEFLKWHYLVPSIVSLTKVLSDFQSSHITRYVIAYVIAIFIYVIVSDYYCRQFISKKLRQQKLYVNYL